MNKKTLYSEYDNRGMLFVDCVECVKGPKGDQSCYSGFKIKKGRVGGCFNGQLLSIYE